MTSFLRTINRLLSAPSFDAVDKWSNIARKEIAERFGDVVSIDPKRKNQFQFGTNDNVQTTGSPVMELPNAQSEEIELTSNDIDTLSSNDTNFNGNIFIEGHTISNGLLTFVTQTINANGQNKVSLPTPLFYVSLLENNDETLFSSVPGDQIFVYRDTAISGGQPIDDSKVHIILSSQHRHSLKAGTGIASTDYGLITQIYASVNRKQATTADIFLVFKEMESGPGRRPGGFKTCFLNGLGSTGRNSFSLDFRPYLIVPKNSLLTLLATSSINGASVSGGVNILLAGVQS